jgi:hypothetical protein
MNIIKNLEEKDHCLILGNAAGGGHIQAVNAIHQTLKSTQSKAKVITIEILTGVLGKALGNLSSKVWNDSQKKERIYILNLGFKLHALLDVLMSATTFFHVVFWLWKNDINKVINLQPMAGLAIIHAVRVMNFANRFFHGNKPKITVSMIVTELPNVNTKNFFTPIKRYTKYDREIFELITAKPLLEKGETEEEFWQKNTGLALSKGEVKYDEFPIRPEFIKLKNTQSNIIDHLQIKVSNAEEIDFIKQCMDLPDLKVTLNAHNNNVIELPLANDDQVFALMLGSQISATPTLDYVKNMIALAKQAPNKNKKHYFFVFCGAHTPGKNSLLKQVRDLILEAKTNDNYPKNLMVLPISFQDSSQIAPLLARCKASITRSGGITAMEVHSLVKGKAFIHLARKQQLEPDQQLSEQDLVKGMPIWERGNFKYLEATKGAELIAPQLVSRAFGQFFEVS